MILCAELMIINFATDASNAMSKKENSYNAKASLSYLCYNTVYPGFFASHKIWKNGKMCSILICVGHFCDLKGFLLKIIQNLISAHSIICD